MSRKPAAPLAAYAIPCYNKHIVNIVFLKEKKKHLVFCEQLDIPFLKDQGMDGSFPFQHYYLYDRLKTKPSSKPPPSRLISYLSSLSGFPSGSAVKSLPTMEEMWVWFLGQEDPLKKEMATHSSILVWEIPWTGLPGRLQSMGLQGVGHNLATKQQESSLSRKGKQ